MRKSGGKSIAKSEDQVLGLFPDGMKVLTFWGSLAEYPRLAEQQSLRSVCPDLGTETCLECVIGLQKVLDVCDFKCRGCPHEKECPCSRYSWEERQIEKFGWTRNSS